jgi:hypothetical protein
LSFRVFTKASTFGVPSVGGGAPAGAHTCSAMAVAFSCRAEDEVHWSNTPAPPPIRTGRKRGRELPGRLFVKPHGPNGTARVPFPDADPAQPFLPRLSFRFPLVFRRFRCPGGSNGTGGQRRFQDHPLRRTVVSRSPNVARIGASRPKRASQGRGAHDNRPGTGYNQRWILPRQANAGRRGPPGRPDRQCPVGPAPAPLDANFSRFSFSTSMGSNVHG